MSLLLGCIGDDFTGSTDLANTLVRQGMRTVQLIGVPDNGPPPSDTDAVVVALKSRTIAAQEAVVQSLAALKWLKSTGCRQFFFKYCSTFDSTDAGNIGPVTDALLEALGADFTIACPAFPETGRTIFKGYLFVGDVLLSESGMKNHPLTPMTDANLVRVFGRQVKNKVGLIPYSVVSKGVEAIRQAAAELQRDGFRYAIADAIDDAHLLTIAEALTDMVLITGGSGIALGLPENFRRRGWLKPRPDAAVLPVVRGTQAVLSGSCSPATIEQVAVMKRSWPALKLDVPTLAANSDQEIASAVAWALPRLKNGPVLIYTTDTPEAVRSIQQTLGRDKAGELAEHAQARIAQKLVDAGVRRLIVAGGETAGSVVSALNIKGLRIGPQIDPGVPWTTSTDETPLALALKSGNFGAPDFFLKAFDLLA